jgi:hypothetical protein
VTRWLPLAVWLATAAGCATELAVQDHSVLFPAFRASRRVGEVWSIAATADYASGSDTASGSGGTFSVGGVSFTGPVAADFDMTTVRLEGRARQEWSPRWIGEGFVGVSVCYVDVTVASGNLEASEDALEVGPHFGGRIGWRPAPRLQVYAEGCFTILLPDGLVPDGAIDLGVEWNVAGPVSTFAGWRFRQLELALEGSDYDFEWSGLFLGLGFDF